jgi:hypothetical protein
MGRMWTETTPQPFEISDEMLDTYKRMRVLRCTCPPWPEDRPYWNPAEDCPACTEWARLNRLLAPLIGLPLHEVHCVPPPHGECFLPDEESARRDLLEQALAEREDEPS